MAKKILQNHDNLSGLRLRLISPLSSQLLSSHLIPSAAFTPVITPFYYIPIMLYYGLQSSTMVLTSCQVRAGTPKQILSPTRQLYHTTFPGSFFFLCPFCPIPDMNSPPPTPAPVWHRQRPTHWLNPALFSNKLFLIWLSAPVWEMSFFFS